MISDSMTPVTRNHTTYVFGPYRLDTARRILYLGSIPSPIPERLFQILLALIRAGGEIVPREVLAGDVWGEAGVTDTNVNQHVYLLRLLLGERKGERSYIVTVPGKGYRFAASVGAATEGEDQLVEDCGNPLERTLDVGDELFQNYCRGSYLLDRRTAASLNAAIDAFERALALDADYVPALIGVARAHALLAEYWHVPPRPAFAKAKIAIGRALRSQPRSSTAHAVRGELLLFADWDWVRAKRSASAAIDLNPQSTFARNNAAWYYVCRADTRSALAEARQALVVEPASLHLQLLQARVLVHAGDFARAVSAMSNILAADPSYHLARRYRAQAYVLSGKFASAVDDLTSEQADSTEDLSFRLPMLARAYAGLGKHRDAWRTYDEIRERAQRDYVAWWNLALAAVAVNRTEEALRNLQTAYSEREPTMLFLRTLPWFKAIEGRPEFKKLIRDIGP